MCIRDRIRADQIVLETYSLQAGGPSSARPICKHTVRAIQHLEISTVLRSEIQGVSIGDEDAVGAFGVAPQKSIEQFNCLSSGTVRDPYTEYRHDVHVRRINR